MKIISFKKLKDNRYKLKMNGEEDIILYDDIILKYSLLITKEIEEKELEKLKKENTSLECYYKAIKYLACKNRSKKEIDNYLKRYEFNRTDIENTIRRLEEQNYINEDNYLQAYINDQINLTNNGPQKIMRKLMDLGFSEEKICQVMNEIDKKIWQTKLEKIIPKKVSANKKDSANKIKEKVLYNLRNEGYRREDIIRILENIELPTNNNSLEKQAQKLYLKLSKKYKEKELEYQLKGKLLAKGFFLEDIEKVIENIKKSFKNE